jgi:hypothetical protein
MYRIYKLVFAVVLLMSMATFAQDQQNQQQTQQQPAAGSTIQLGGINLERNQELPQVQILDRRKTIKFEPVQIDKDFKSELSGKAEELRIIPANRQKVKTIKNINILLNKNRY